MTEISYICKKHGIQTVDEMILPYNIHILNCGCIYGRNYRIKTGCCDKCGFVIEGLCLITSDIRFYHIECAKGMGKIENGKIMDIDEYPDFKIEGLERRITK